MIRLAAVVSAVVLLIVPVRTMPVHVVIVPASAGLLLAAFGIVMLWRWAVTVAACVFLTDYALALSLAGAPVGLVPAAGFGFALLGLLHSLELARCARRASVHAGVARSQLAGWIVFLAATAAAVTLAMIAAIGVAPALPFPAAPILAAAGALGVVLALAAALRPWGRT
jgi:hypothetical protein